MALWLNTRSSDFFLKIWKNSPFKICIFDSFDRRLKSKRLRRQIHDSDDPTINISDEGNFLQDIDISTIIPDVSRELENSCPAEIAACDPSYPYRSFTGYCNNLRKPNWGKSLTTFARILPPAYDNGSRNERILIFG